MTLSPAELAFLAAARTATLATIDPTGRPRLVPICFVVASSEGAVDGLVLYSPLDEKPKTVADPRALARVRDIGARPAVWLLIDRWSEDWAQLAWLRLHGQAFLVEPGAVPPGVLAALRAKYPQYLTHALEDRPMLTIGIEATTSWGLAREP